MYLINSKLENLSDRQFPIECCNGISNYLNGNDRTYYMPHLKTKKYWWLIKKN